MNYNILIGVGTGQTLGSTGNFLGAWQDLCIRFIINYNAYIIMIILCSWRSWTFYLS